MAEPRLSALLAMRPDVQAQAFPPELVTRLSRTVDLVGGAVTDFADPAVAARLGEVEVVISSWGCPPIGAALLAAAPRLRAVVHAAGSVKGHVSPLVWERGVLVSSAAVVNAEPVAQYTLAMILLAGKQAFQLARGYAAGGDPVALRARAADLGNHRRTVGVVGASKIGRLVLSSAADHGFDLLVSDPTLDAEQAARLAPDGRARLVGLDTLMRDSDVVSIHAPLLPGTVGLIDDRRLALMRDGATLVNTARGAIVDTEALTRHCLSGRIAAVLDVTEPEPLPAGHPLLSLPNVLVTPHVAGALGTEVVRLGEYAVRDVERIAAGLPPAGLVQHHELGLIA